jgi:hypothetical protein
MSDFEVNVETTYETIRIYVNELIHVLIKRDEFVGIQSWGDGGGKWCIAFYTKTGIITTEQDSREKWESILRALKNITL